MFISSLLVYPYLGRNLWFRLRILYLRWSNPSYERKRLLSTTIFCAKRQERDNIEIKTEQLVRRQRNGVHLCSITVLAAAVAAGSLSSLSSCVAAVATTGADVDAAAVVAAVAASFPQIASLRYTEARNFYVVSEAPAP